MENEKKLEVKAFSDALNKWQRDVESAIAERMEEKGIKVISLINNASDKICVDTPYADFLMDKEDVKQLSIGLIIRVGKHILISAEEDLDDVAYVTLSEKGDLFSEKAWDEISEEVINSIRTDLVIDETFSPANTLMSLLSSVSQILDDGLCDTPLNENEIRSIF